MKIVIDARLYGTKHTGNGRYTQNLVENLTKIDSTNTYYILLRKDDYESLNFPKNFVKILADFKHYTFKEQFLLPIIIYKIKPDIVHFPHFNVPIFYFGKFIVTIHDMIMHKSKGGEATTRPFPIYQIWRLGYYLAFAKAVYFSNLIICPTNVVKDDLSSFYKINKDKIKVTYEGIDTSTNQTDFKADNLGKYISYVGNAYPHKNLRRLIKALSIYNKKNKLKINLAISAARNVFIERIEKLAKKYKVQKNLKILGYVPDNQLMSFYNKSIAFIYPTLIEGFGLPGLEAMRAKTLVYSSNIDVLKEVYKDNVKYFNPKSVKEIVNSINDAVHLNEADRQKIISKAYEFTKNYSWQKMAKETLNIYQMVV